MAMNRKEYRQEMANIFIDSLEKATAEEWVRPWQGHDISEPFNGKTNRYYNGSNQFSYFNSWYS